MSQDELVLVALNTFDSEWIETSKKVLFELCPNTKQRCVAFKGNQKDANNIKSCLKVLNECGENIPRFVSHYLDELPPVTFNNMDVTNLLSKMERLHSEVCALRHTVKLQADVGDSLYAVTTAIDQRVNALEQHLEPSHGTRNCLDLPSDGGLLGASAEDGGVELVTAAGVSGSPVDSELIGVGHASEPCTRSGLGEGVGAGGLAVGAAVCSGGIAALPDSPKWSYVVKQGRRMKKHTQGQSALGKEHAGRPERRMPKPIVGTGAQGNIKVVRTKLVSVFATKFSPDLNAETLANYLKEKLGRDVTCQRIVTVSNRYSSFKVCVECSEVAEMYNPELWPEGSVVRRYYEPRKAGVTGINVISSTLGVDVPIRAMAALSS